MKVLTKEVMQGFVGSVLQKRFDEPVKTPWFHIEWWDLCCQDNKFIAIAAPRHHAKSTAITFSFTLACILFRERKYVVIVSDTEAQANLFLGAIKQELRENEDLHRLFKLKKDEKGEVEFIKDTESDLIGQFEDGWMFRITAKGSEQKLRGLLWNGSRPDLLVLDDMENEELTYNQDRREKFKKWFYGALLPCRSKDGIVRFVGTILHMDSMLENLMPIETDKTTLKDDLKIFSTKKTLWKSVKYRAHTDDFKKILWPDRYPEDELRKIRDDYRERGLSEVYSREFLNIPIDESIAYFKRNDFLPIIEKDRKYQLNYYITVDLAITDKQRSDFSVFLIAGVDEERRIHVKDVIRERLDGREIVNTLIHLQQSYKPVAIGIEESQISKSIGPFLNEEMIRSNEFINLYPLKHMGQDKLARSRSIQARMRAHSIKFELDQDWFVPFQNECMRFPRDKHDDQVDAFAYLGLMLDKLLEAPTLKEQEDEEYDELYQKSGLMEQGRNLTCGY